MLALAVQVCMLISVCIVSYRIVSCRIDVMSAHVTVFIPSWWRQRRRFSSLCFSATTLFFVGPSYWWHLGH